MLLPELANQLAGVIASLDVTLQEHGAAFEKVTKRVRPLLADRSAWLTRRFDTAFAEHAGVMTRARVEGTSQNLVKGFVIGTAASVLVSAGALAVPSVLALGVVNEAALGSLIGGIAGDMLGTATDAMPAATSLAVPSAGPQ